MDTQEWFRRRTWSDEDAAQFERKLARSRGQRPEYLRIQAHTLAETEDRALAGPAIVLATRYLEENPVGGFRAQVLCTIAQACVTTGDFTGAVESFRRAVEAERQGRVRCCAYLQFAWFAVNQGRSELYDEVLDLLGESFRDEDLVFPVAQYKYFGALAIISDAQGDPENAARMARNALGAAAKQESPFARHPTVGLVENKETGLHHRLQRLAG